VEEAESRGRKKGAVKEIKHAASKGKKEKGNKGRKIKNQKPTPSGVPH
jgi:hypothetical protein